MTFAPRRCSSALVATVVPMLSAPIASAATPQLSIAFITACAGRRGVEGVLAITSSIGRLIDTDQIGKGAPGIDPHADCHTVLLPALL